LHEESAFSPAFVKKQIPRRARDEKKASYFGNL
jgi:hypothetical protein